MKKINRILIANRGEIAVRIQRTCRALGIETVALYTGTDKNSLHVRLADTSIQIPTPGGFSDQGFLLEVAKRTKADAIHPGYGFLAERADFIRACDAEGLIFIGPSARMVEDLTDKIAVLGQAEAAGFPVVAHSRLCFEEADVDELAGEAEKLGYPVVIKSCRGGRGRGERIVFRPDQLSQAAFRAQSESQAVYGQRSVYLEKALLPAHQINVQILGDQDGNRVHLGEREGSILLGNQKLIEESPAPGLNQEQRSNLWQMAMDIASRFELHHAAAIEFLIGSDGAVYFTEIKARIQVEHPLSESLSRLDLIAEQIRLAAGEPLNLTQDQVDLSGWGIQCRLTAQNPWGNDLPNPGTLRSVRFPGGPDVRVDSFISAGVDISTEYDPLLAKVSAWAPSRAVCLRRLQLALAEFQIIGVSTNQPLLQAILSDPHVIAGKYDTDISVDLGVIGSAKNQAETSSVVFDQGDPDDQGDNLLRDLAVAVAIGYFLRNQAIHPEIPERINTGWHRQSRRLQP